MDADTGNNSNACTAISAPCLTVDAAAAKAAPGGGGTVRIDRGDTYLENVIVPTGVSLSGEEIAGPDTGPAIIDGGAGTGVSVIPGASAGTIRGLTLRGNQEGLGLFGNAASITQNVFDDPTAGARGISMSNGVGAQITGNTFTGDGTTLQVAMAIGDGSVTVTGNTISGYWLGISAQGTGGAGATSTPTIAGNTITGTHQSGMQAGAAIFITQGSNPLIEANDVIAPGSGASAAIYVNGFSEPASTGATLRRNLVRGHNTGISLIDTVLPTTSTSDVVSGATSAGLEVKDQAAVSPSVANSVITNGTFWGNAIDVRTFNNTLTLDSTVVEDPIDDFTATCAISFSRGPTTTGSSCDTFQTTAAPLFVNAAANDFHLQPASPMIDAGNPSAPLAGVLDLDGEPRALDATPTTCADLVQRRDIGADEFFAVQPVCAPPTPPTPPKKKCKKAKKKKAAGAAKKCKKRKKR